jgi:hypothetical protein
MKKKINEIISGYLIKHLGEEEKIEEFSMFIEEFFDNVHENYVDVHTDFYAEIEDFTEEVDEEMITQVVEHLRHKDGTLSGAKWTLEEVQTVAKQYDVKTKIEACGKVHDCHRFWFALNYVYAVHYSINRTINGYVDLAIDEMCNKNVCFDKIIKKIFEKI